MCLIIKCNVHVGKKNLEEYTKHNVFNLPTKIFIENYMKSFSEDPFNDEFPQSLMKSEIKWVYFKLFLLNLSLSSYYYLLFIKSFFNIQHNSLQIIIIIFNVSFLLNLFSTGLELALKCIKDKNYEEIEDACKEELKKTDNSLIRRTLALNLLATFSILRGNYVTGVEHLTTVIETPGVPNKV